VGWIWGGGVVLLLSCVRSILLGRALGHRVRITMASSRSSSSRRGTGVFFLFLASTGEESRYIIAGLHTGEIGHVLGPHWPTGRLPGRSRLCQCTQELKMTRRRTKTSHANQLVGCMCMCVCGVGVGVGVYTHTHTYTKETKSEANNSKRVYSQVRSTTAVDRLQEQKTHTHTLHYTTQQALQ
jgi:hypothetical protein